MTSPILTKSFLCAADIAGFLIVAAEGTDKQVQVASDPTELLIGAADEMGGKTGGMVDIDVAGWSSVRFGDDVDFGTPLTTDANGKAVAAVPVAGSVIRCIGFAMCDAADGDVGPYQIAPHVIATPAAA